MLKIGRILFYAVITSITSITSIANSQVNEFTIEGNVAFTKTGDIHMKLMNREQFDRDVEGKDPQTPFTLVLKSNTDESKGKAQFKFNKVPKGVYAISYYQDVNGNGKCDMGLMGPKEPWGMYKVKPVFKPVFKKISFELNEDMLNLSLEVK